MWRLVHDPLPPKVCSVLNPVAIYANNEISLHDVEVYGFDYDYMLAQYSDSLHPGIFSTTHDILIEPYKYPHSIHKYDYNPSFAIHGLHYDIQKTLLMNIDAFHHVQLEMTYRDLQPVPDEVNRTVWGLPAHPTVPDEQFCGKGPSIKQLTVISLLETALITSWATAWS